MVLSSPDGLVMVDYVYTIELSATLDISAISNRSYSLDHNSTVIVQNCTGSCILVRLSC